MSTKHIYWMSMKLAQTFVTGVKWITDISILTECKMETPNQNSNNINTGGSGSKLLVIHLRQVPRQVPENGL